MLLELSNPMLHTVIEHTVNVYLLVSKDETEHELIRVFIPNDRLTNTYSKASSLLNTYVRDTHTNKLMYVHKVYFEIDDSKCDHIKELVNYV